MGYEWGWNEKIGLKTVKATVGVRGEVDVKLKFEINQDFCSTPEGVVHACANVDLKLSVVGQLAKSSVVEYLDLSFTGITDACIDDLVKMQRLNEVHLFQTRISSKKIDELRAKGVHVNCSTSVDEGPPPEVIVP